MSAGRASATAGTTATTTSSASWRNENGHALRPLAGAPPRGCGRCLLGRDGRPDGGEGSGGGDGPRRARLVRGRLGDDDGRDDAPVAVAHGGGVLARHDRWN